MGSEPEAKKVKLLEITTRHDLHRTEVIPRAVLADDYTREVQTVQAYAANIKDRKQTSTLLRQLKTVFPLKELGHLKRIRCLHGEKESVLQILLCLVEDTKGTFNPQNDFFQALQLPVGAISQPFMTDVPKYPPLTREQFNEASKLWPVTFHEDKYISKAIEGKLFDRLAVQNIVQFMRMAIAAAEKSASKFPIGAVIVDPQRNHPIAVSHDLRDEGHPLQHAVMVCIDLVAHSQLKGAWKLDCKESYGTWIMSKSMSAVYHEETSSVSNHLPNSIAESGKSGPYLCTGYDIYVTREPCVMCAMALLHSRIRRVFYSCKDSAQGALGSRYKIHTKAGLNHHFEVFCGILEDETTKLLYGKR